jgi:hypothetical protein
MRVRAENYVAAGKKVRRFSGLLLHGIEIAYIKGTRVFRFSLLLSVSCCAFALSSVDAAGLSKSETRFVFIDAKGKVQSAQVISRYTGKLTNPFPHLDPKLARAATIAEERAHAHSKMRCWRYVKEALLASGAINSYPQTTLARQAGDELVQRYGFKRLAVRDPYQAPIGAVLVYGSGRAAGHVEIRTAHGFVSDFRTPTPSRRPLIGVYAKTSS